MNNYKIYDNSLQYSGNRNTLNRLSNILNLPKTNQIENYIIGIHLFKFGKLVINKNLNFIVIIGGTDINIDHQYPEKFNIMKTVILEAKYVICFSPYIHLKTTQLFGTHNKYKIIPQSVQINENIHSHNLSELYNANKIFLFIGNVRSVKDPIFLIEIFKKLYALKNYKLIIVGKNVENKEYDFNNGIIYYDGLPHDHIFFLMKNCNGLINSSKSEGMSLSILEAMKLRCPVYVRNNYGNLSIVKDKCNGYVFETADELEQILELDTDIITENAYNYVNIYHNVENERNSYFSIINV